MLIVALNGSPRRGGNTQTLLDEALAAARQDGATTVRLDLATMNISSCTACDDCKTSKQCTIRDDMTLVYELLDKADALLVGTPIYFSGPSSQLKCSIDRAQAIWNRGPDRTGRPAALVAVGGDPEATFRNARSEVRSFLNVVGFECQDELFVPGLERRGEVSANGDVMAKAQEIGHKLFAAAQSLVC